MTAPLRNTQHASAIAAIQASQSTAPVAEFRCLFTHDVRRKQKRWQDGFLKFHTFNNRVMVYDHARNFLGDTYYKDSDELHEGDELNLNNGALVEVSEPVGITHTDLAAVLGRKAKDLPPAQNPPSQTKPYQRPSSVAPPTAQKAASQLRHKSLNTLLGTPKGPIGKAQPIKSPYEARKEKEKEKENELAGERAAKRQKTSQAPASWRASSPAQEENVEPKEPSPRPTKAVAARKARQPAKFIPPTATVITIEDEPEPEPEPHPAMFSDITLPGTPPRVAGKIEELQAAKTIVPRQPPVQTPRIPKGRVPLPGVRALETPRQPAPPSSPPVSASNRLSNIEFALQPVQVPSKEPSPPRAPSSPPARKARCLRLSTGVKRGKLLCQPLPPESAKDDSISAKRSPRNKRVLTNAEHGAAKRARVSRSPSFPSPSLHEDPEVIHGLMDQQLLVTSSPIHPDSASSRAVDGISKSKHTVGAMVSDMAVQTNTVQPMTTKSKASSTNETTGRRPTRKAEKPKAAPRAPSPVLRDPGIPTSRDVSPAHTEVSDAQSRTSAISSRKVSLSTGGILKKAATRTKKQSALTDSKQNAPTLPPQSEPVSLSPRPSRANKKAPLMSTTELAGLLQKPKNLAKALADPIEDGGETNHEGKSPNRTFRRVRSENDAPIPSISEEWERLNLPKPSSPATDTVNEPTMASTVAVEKKKKKDSGLGTLIKKTDPRRKFKRTQSLQVDTHVAPPAAEEEVDLPSPVMDLDVGPWSTEAGDLFDWRPPGRL
ncbi:hypothetical protein COCMIDRAFT_96448 [Bipolaris oryzae ATCC 44560]|uniref:5'-3' DNA helicase ZGRF1-like N-terminal domain-containing protein n=1 Tax=Bipolaris oryzae ATCC 44560 TaxID=930090 RepID=W6ZNG3_COCMI|nr:uncharacterized protein COCMIDRAFT_96448 [Bipolaris oryzae ATCC 44560]EUC45111.1 hypothetical protein COCMIDRAFT_96448 [Bipolaris oryzae ATCC 44560]